MVIRATDPLFIQLAVARNGLMEAAQLLPVTYASKWIVGSYSPAADLTNLNAYSLLSLDNTTNTVQVTEQGSGFPLPLQSLVSVRRSSSSFDLTGSSITSDHDIPLVVMMEMNGVLIPDNVQYPGCLLEQIPPVNDWGKTFVVPSIVGVLSSGAGFVVRIVAGYDNTVVWHMHVDIDTYDIVQGSVTLLHSGNWTELHTDDFESYFVNCSMPCLVVQYNPGFDYDAFVRVPEYSAPGPFMLTVPPISQYTTNVSFSTIELLPETKKLHYLRIVVLDDEEIKNSICLDDEASCGDFNWKETIDVDGQSYALGWWWLQEPGFHTIFSKRPDALYCVFVYGHFDVESRNGSYGYTASYKSMFIVLYCIC